MRAAWQQVVACAVTIMSVRSHLTEDMVRGMSSEQFVLAWWPPTAEEYMAIQHALASGGHARIPATYRKLWCQFEHVPKRQLALANGGVVPDNAVSTKQGASCSCSCSRCQQCCLARTCC
jgi:hypothetical protein